MTIEPATDARIEELRAMVSDPDGPKRKRWDDVRALIATIGTLRERAEKAEATINALIDQNRTYRNQGIAVAERLETAESEAAALHQEVERLAEVVRVARVGFLGIRDMIEHGASSRTVIDWMRNNAGVHAQSMRRAIEDDAARDCEMVPPDTREALAGYGRDNLITLAAKLRESINNPHRATDQSEKFKRLMHDCADALAALARMGGGS
tara:strand:+ start:20031 stop:20660 length:630 start_codon:yes stop_codon:yes gene_type:complete